MTKRIDELVENICGSADHPIAPFLRRWCDESRPFLAFAEAHASKIRKKARLAALDDALAALAAARNPPAAFVPTLRPPLTSPTGSSSTGPLAEDVSSDSLHLNRKGYGVLARWIVADGGDVGRLLAP